MLRWRYTLGTRTVAASLSGLIPYIAGKVTSLMPFATAAPYKIVTPPHRVSHADDSQTVQFDRQLLSSSPIQLSSFWYDFCSPLSLSLAGQKGGALVSTLHSYSHHGDPYICSLLTRILTKVLNSAPAQVESQLLG